MKQLLTRLKPELRFNIFLLILLMFVLLIRLNWLKPVSVYTGDEKIIIGKIIEIKEGKFNNKLVVKALENIEVVDYKKLNYNLGDTVKIIGKLKKPDIAPVFNVFQYSDYLKSKKIYFQMKVYELEIVEKDKSYFYKIKNNLIKYLNKQKHSDYLKAFIIGDNSEINSTTKKTIDALGISHLFALSGMHVSLISLVLFSVLNKLFPNKITLVLWILILLFYLALTNFLPSITRSIICTIVTKTTKFKPINVILVLAIFLILINPYYIYNLSFIFSFTIYYFLVLFSKEINNNGDYLSKLFYTSMIAFLVSIPILGINFFEINLMTPFINIIFIPFVSLILFPVTIIVFLIPPLMPVLTFSINIFELLLNVFDSLILIIPLASGPLYFYLIYFLLILLIKISNKNIIWIFLFILFHSFIYTNINDASITMIDVNQGDSTLIRLPNNNGNILIDTGGLINSENLFLAKTRIIPYLKSVGIKKLDYLILTHGDSDHIKEAQYLIDNFKIDKVIFNNDEFNELESKIIKVLETKNISKIKNVKELNIDNRKLYFLNTKQYDNENDNSNIIYTTLNGVKILLMGDAGIKVEKEIIKKYNLNDIDILKVGHHGSKTSSSKAFINEVNPKFSIISVGKNNLYGHPNKVVFDNLKNSRMYRTDQDGSIMFKIYKDKVKIEKYFK